MAGQEIGVAYVSLLPSGKGFTAATRKQTDDAFQGAERSSSGFFSRITKGALAVVGTATAALGALTIGKGLSRVLNIEDAQAKLKGLGNDTKTVEAIMNDALASVRGTSFGLDTAATVAATAVAAGIKPGKELEKYLRLTADAATIAGVSMEEMGSILNKATTAGKVYTQELNQLADRGLPIFQWLQDEYGVTAEELRKMVADGKVDAETFRKVIEENIGGAALASGDTTRGALANVGAALGRLGAMFVGPALGGAKVFFNEVITIIDGIAERVGPMVSGLSEQFSGMFNLEGLGDRTLGIIDNIGTGFAGIGNALSGLSGLTPVFTALAGAMAPLLSSLPLIGRFLPAISGPVGAIVGLLAGLLIESEPLRESLTGLAETIGGALASAFDEAGGALSDFGPVVSEVLQVLGGGLAEAVTAITPAIGVLVEALGQVFETVAPLFEPLMQIVTAVLALLGPIGQLVGAVLPPLIDLFMMALGPVVQLAGTILNALLPVIEGLVTYLSGLIEFVSGVFTGNWTQAWTGIQTVFQGIVNTIGSVFVGLGNILAVVWNGWVTHLSGVIGWLQSVFKGAFTGLVGFFAGIWNNISSGVSNAWNGVMSFLGSIPGRIKGFFSGIGTWLLDSGRALIQGFIDGIKGMIGNVGNAVGGIMDFVGGFFPHSPAKHGPFSGSGWTAVSDGGASLMEQFTTGAETFSPQISFGNVTGVISGISTQPPSTGIQPGDRVVFEVEGTPLTAVAKKVLARAADGFAGAVTSRFGSR